MASEKQIAANRANAKKSTGPKTAAGKLKASQNALRHGLSLALQPHTMTSTKADAIAGLLAPPQANDEQRMAATDVAHAQLDLIRIRAVRAGLTAELKLASGDIVALRRLAALDRYERLAHTRRRRAARKL